MHVWMLLESIGNFILLKNEVDLLPSVWVSYSTCLDVKIEHCTKINPDIVAFKVTGRRKDPDHREVDVGASLFESFDHTVQFQRVCVYDEPTHL